MAGKEKNLETDFAHLARIALAGRAQDVQLLLHRVVKRYRSGYPELADSLAELLREAPTRASPLRRQSEIPLPVDGDSRLQLLRVEASPTVDHAPVFANEIERSLNQLIGERRNPAALIKAGLQPSKSVLFTGAPGVGKTLAARWLARELGRPLLVLDLAAVISSYLGRTGGNLRNVLDYAKDIECVLLLDELDAIAKRRDDAGELGELKRLVTVLIQEIDDWPSSGLLVAATNHPELLDPAIWRRFEMVLDFPIPDAPALTEFIHSLLHDRVEHLDAWSKALGLCLVGRSFSDVERELISVRRATALDGASLDDALAGMLRSIPESKADRIELATVLVDERLMSQRRACELTGVARDTVRSRRSRTARTDGEATA